MSKALSKILVCGSLAFAVSVGGCAGHMIADPAASETRGGYDDTRAGLDRVREGMNEYGSGDRQSTLTRMHEGLGMMAQGMNSMHAGIGMMSGDMMRTCKGSDSAVGTIERAMSSMGDGLKMLEDADPNNDGDGMTKMKGGMTSAEDGMKMMGTFMSCMDHGSMM